MMTSQVFDLSELFTNVFGGTEASSLEFEATKHDDFHEARRDNPLPSADW